MKFANVYRVIISSRSALRLAFFSFLCLAVFAMSSTRLVRVAPAASAANAQTAQQKRGTGGGKTISVRAKDGSTRQAAATETTTPSAVAEKGAKAASSTGAQAAAVCPQNTTITYNQTVNGELTLNDCPNPIPLPDGRPDPTVVDEYLFTGQPGDRISINMTAISPAFDTFLYLLAPNGTVLAQNDDVSTNPVNRNSRITFVLTTAGTHSILANSFAPEERGTYSLSLTLEGSCETRAITFSDTPTQGTLTNGDCMNIFDPNDKTSFIEYYTFNGTMGQQIAITMERTSGTIDPFLYLLLPTGEILADDSNGGGGTTARIPFREGFGRLPMSGTYTIVANTFAGGQTGNFNLTLTTASVPCPSTSVAIDSTTNGTLATSDCRLLEDGSFIDAYTFDATANQTVSITMRSNTGTLIPALFLLAPDGRALFIDDNKDGENTARVPDPAGTFVLPTTGRYTILTNSTSASATATGDYTLSLTSTAQPACTVTLASTSRDVPGSVGQFSVAATPEAGCTVTATPNVNWLTATVVNNNTVNITVQANATQSPRTGTITINDKTFTVTQAVQSACTVTLDSSSRDVSSGSGQFSVAVTTQAGCTVTATSNVPWLTATVVNNNTVNYTVQANTTSSTRTGTITINDKTFTVTQAGQPVCTYTLASSSQAVAGSGGQFNVAVTTQAGCAITASASDPSWLTNISTANNNGAGTVTFRVQPNTTSSARTGTITINGQTFTVNQAVLVCTYTLPEKGQTVSSGGGIFSFTVQTQEGCVLQQPVPDSPWIIIRSFSIDNGTGIIDFRVLANDVTTNRTGTITVGALVYTVTQTSAAVPPPAFQFRLATFTVSENDAARSATITVERTGDTTGTATVEYATIDDPASVPCDPTLRRPDGTDFPRGTAYARCDYSTSIDTLTFAARETQKTFTIPLINDVHVEGSENLRIELRNAQGASLGTQATATLTITDDDTTASSTNPINQSPFFVRQQYLDFLSREPDEGGLNAWLRVLNTCPDNIFNGPNVPSGCDRIYVSGEGFFRSVEFQLKGIYVFLYYKASFGSPNNPNYVPQYDQFVPDIRRVTGQTAEEVFAKRLKFSTDWVARTEFVNIYASTSDTEFVDRLLANLNISLTTADPDSGVTRNSLIASLGNGSKQRAEVLRLIVESREAITVQNNRAFVAIQYYGYLRRTPEAGGYQAWLNVLNDPNINPQVRTRTMINGFLNSPEYRLRFGPNVLQ